MKNNKATCLLLLLILLGLGCGFKDLEYRGYQNFKIEKIGFSQSTLLVELKYYNPNPIGLELKQMDLDVYINDQYLGHTKQNYQIKIPKKGTFVLPVKLNLDMKNLLKNALTGLLNKEVALKTSGKIMISKGKIIRNFPFKYETKEKFSFFE